MLSLGLLIGMVGIHIIMINLRINTLQLKVIDELQKIKAVNEEMEQILRKESHKSK
jgi:hypothetical protein